MPTRNYKVKLENIADDHCSLRIYGGPCKLKFSEPKFLTTENNYEAFKMGDLSVYLVYPCTLEEEDFDIITLKIPNTESKYQTLTIIVSEKDTQKTFSLSIAFQVGAEAIFTEIS